MSDNDLRIHREEYLYLPGLTHNSALIAWGAFYFKVKGPLDGGKWELIDDDDLGDFNTSRTNLIGANSAPYGADGSAEVIVTEKDTDNSQRVISTGANHALIRDLRPDTVYTYSVIINGRPWAAGQLRDWIIEDDKGAMRVSNTGYTNEFHTFPNPVEASPELTFAILGDYGRGVKKPSKEGDSTCQRAIAESLQRALERFDIRFLLSTGDNIYHGGEQGSGEEDDDWFYTYFQPYRYVINRVPLFTAIGNHDEGETFGESSDDRRQLYDNLYISHRFVNQIPTGEASLEPGLFYRFKFGADIELICVDTSKQRWLFSERYFRHPNHQQFLNDSFPADGGQQVRWRIPFFHHPPFCAGPNHKNKQSVIDHIVPRFRQAGVRAAFCGHEHNFQLSLDQGINYFVTGGSGKFQKEKPDSGSFEDARTQVWGGNEEGHFTLVQIDGTRMEVTPYGNLSNKELRPIDINVVEGDQSSPPFVVEAES